MSPPTAFYDTSNAPSENNIKTYYKTKIEEAQQLLTEKTQNVRRLQGGQLKNCGPWKLN